MKYIQPFREITKQDSRMFGGKVASLGEMIRNKIPVPNGFGISVEAHREFSSKPFSDEFNGELLRAFNKLGAKRVAVRSSAVAEDSGEASWAGQLESYLNTPLAELEQDIRRCWQSVEARHVKAYAEDKHLAKDALLVGVAVQAMVESEAAGVMFTVNPVTGHKDEIIIEATYGLGELVVQGIVTPDRYVVDTKTLTVSEFNITIKEQMMLYANGKNSIVKVPDEIADRNVLWETEISKLAHIGLKIATHYGAPQDIEWAKSRGKFFIVQARPITTL
jgi:pyruvate,water dikinase